MFPDRMFADSWRDGARRTLEVNVRWSIINHFANAGRSGVLTAPKALVRQIEGRFGDAIREIFGIEPTSLTADEGAYIFNFRDADAIRARFAAALRERVERLRAKGIQASEDNGEVS